jgi:hypothetical protein
MAGVVHIPWYATVFRGDKLEGLLEDIAPVALRYGASSYFLHRNRDDRYKFLQTATFESKSDWDRYWNGPEFVHFRVAASSYYQVPVLYSWNDVVIEGYLDSERVREGLRPSAEAVGDTL